MSERIYNLLKQSFGDGIVAYHADTVDPWIEITSDRLFEVCRFLQETPELNFDLLNCISGVDYFLSWSARARAGE